MLTEKLIIELIQIAFKAIMKGQDRQDTVYAFKNIIGGALRAISDRQKRTRVIKAASAGLSEESMAKLLVPCPYSSDTWTLVDSLGETFQTKYWNEVVPDWLDHSDGENNEGVERLLKAGRPRAAFSSIRFKPNSLDGQVLFRLLSDMAKGGNDKSGEYMLEHYNLEEAFKHLNSSPGLTLDQKASLELPLSMSWRAHGISVPTATAFRTWNGM